ncbi:MAG: carboxypeptidase regulatory-like domain-containing protein [Blastocatellia bacterium]
MNRGWLLVALATVVLLAVCSTGAGQTSQNDSGQRKLGGVISGFALVNDKPTAGIAISLAKTSIQRYRGLGPPNLVNAVLKYTGDVVAKAKTREDGSYRFENIPPGSYAVDCPEPTLYRVVGGYPASSSTITSRPIDLRNGETVDHIDLRLMRGGTISGRVLGHDGKPVVGAWVSVDQVAPSGLPAQGCANCNTGTGHVTDRNGAYSINGLAPGSYRIQVRRIPKPTDVFVYPVTYFPGTPNWDAAQGVEIKSREELSGKDVKLRPLIVHMVTGSAVGVETGQPLAELAWRLQREASQDWSTNPLPASSVWTGHTDLSGAFLVPGVPRGHYCIEIEPGSPQGEYYGDPVVFDVDGNDVSGISVQVRKGMTMSGTVVYANPDEAPPFDPSDLQLFTGTKTDPPFPELLCSALYSLGIGPTGWYL